MGLTPNRAYEWQVAIQCGSDFFSDFSALKTFVSECVVPTNANAYASERSVSLSWNYNENVVSYTVQYRRQGTADWTTINTGTNSPSYTINDITGAFEWRMQANCGSGIASDFTTVGTFSTYCNTPGTPTVSNLSAYGATIAWDPGSSFARYNLQWKPAGTTDRNTITDVAQSPYVLTGLVGNANFLVRIQAQCGNAQSTYTQIVGFSETCSAPVALSSVAYNYTTESGRQFFWKEAAGGSYTLRWRQLVSIGQPAAEWIIRENATSGYFAAAMLPGTYEWQLQRVCVDGSTSAFVGGSPFTMSACRMDLITTYTSLVESTSALLTYTTGAITELRWRAVGSAGWNVVSPIGYPLVLLTGLIENGAYEWQVRVLCDNNLTPAFGPIQTFTTACGQPADLTTRCTTPSSADLRWTGSPGSTYEVNWRLVGATSWSSVLVNGLQLTLNDLATKRNYEWRVRPACSPVSATAFVGTVTFTALCSSPQALTQTTSCGQALLSWQGGCSALNNFVVRVRTNYGTWTEYSVSGNSLNLNGLAPYSSVEYQVKVACGADYSDYSPSYYFTAQACPPCIPAVLNQSVTSISAYLSWQANTPVAELRWRTSGGTWTTVSTTGTYYQLNGLVTNTIYEWQVRTICPNSADFGPISFFKTRCDAPFTDIYGLSVDADNIWFYYGRVPDQTYEIRYRAENGAWVTQTVANSPAVLSGLAPNTRYEMQLRTTCTGGVVSGWSPSRYATTACPAPTFLQADQITDNSVRLNWRYNANIASRGYARTLRYRPLGSTNWATVSLNTLPLTSTLSYTLTGLNSQTSYEWQVLYDCATNGTSTLTGGPITFRTTGAAQPCSVMMTVLDGDWTDPATWSCGRVPTVTDRVQIRHRVLMPATISGQAQGVLYGTGGQLRYGIGSSLRLVQ